MDIAVLERAFQRERKQRKHAEELLENKSRELFLSYEELKEAHSSLSEAHEELKHKQRQLVQSEKMASIGVLSAGVAHEINNPIGFILSNINTFSSYMPIFKNVHSKLLNITEKTESQAVLYEKISMAAVYLKDEEVGYLLEDAGDIIEETTEGIQRVKEIVAGLKDFVREDQGEKESANINESIQSTLKLLSNQLKYHCEIIENYGDIPDLPCHIGKLNQVFMNMMVNAGQAIKEKGTITIETKKLGNHIMVSFSDTGSGISEENLANLYTPFFTTKPVGEGTGLGLSISHGIIEEHGGEIDVESELGKGTTFTIKLPVDR